MASASRLFTKSPSSSTTVTLRDLGLLWSLLLVATAIVHRAYSFQTTSPGLEVLRQSGAIVVLGQLAFVLWALQGGWNPLAHWRDLTRPVQIAALWFISTFWIGSAFNSPISAFALVLCIGTLIQILFALALSDRLSTTSADAVAGLQNAMCVGLAIIVVMTIAHFWSAPPAEMAPGGLIVWQAAIPGFISVRLFGAVCGAVLTLLVATALTRQVNALNLIVIVLVSGLTAWTGTRAAVVGLFGAIIVGFVLLRLRPPVKRILLIATCLAIGALLGPAFAPTGDPVFNLFEPQDYSTATSAGSGRVEIWTAMLTAFAASPVFGLGSAASSWAMPPEIFPHIQPHNFVVQFLSYWGLAGAIPAFALLGYATIKAHMIARRLPAIVPIVMMLDALLLMALLDGILHFARETMMVMMCFAIIFAADRQSRASASG